MSSPRRLALVGIVLAAALLGVVIGAVCTRNPAARDRRTSNAPSIEVHHVSVPDRDVMRPPADNPRPVPPDVEITEAIPPVESKPPSKSDSDIVEEQLLDILNRLDVPKADSLKGAAAAILDAEKRIGDSDVFVRIKPDGIRVFVSPSQNRRRSGSAIRGSRLRSDNMRSPNRKRAPVVPDQLDRVTSRRQFEQVGRYNIWD